MLGAGSIRSVKVVVLRVIKNNVCCSGERTHCDEQGIDDSFRVQERNET
jgi:hypothetical protein